LYRGLFKVSIHTTGRLGFVKFKIDHFISLLSICQQCSITIRLLKKFFNTAKCFLSCLLSGQQGGGMGIASSRKGY
jgi:hypothetical protein